MTRRLRVPGPRCGRVDGDWRVLMVGLTGGIGAGKSAVARRLAERGAVIIDSDRLAREVVAPGTEGWPRWSPPSAPGCSTADGALDRPALGAEVFGDEAARRRLEGIIHPRVRARTAELVAAAAADAMVVNDVPLLVEAGLAPTYHLVVVVRGGADPRLRRLLETRGMTRRGRRARIAAQADDDRRRAVADVVLHNDGTLEDLPGGSTGCGGSGRVPYEENLRLREPRPPGPEVAPRRTRPVLARAGRPAVARIRRARPPSSDGRRTSARRPYRACPPRTRST